MCLGRVYCSLGLTHLCLIGLVVDDEEQLAGTNGLSLMDTNLGYKARYLRTDLYILNTFDSGRIRCLHFCTLGLNRSHGILVVCKVWLAARLAST